jgi:small-conductance mechanosensitive channel/CRP-like cAMP-binding protein
MGQPGFRPLIGPAALALTGFLLRAVLPVLPEDGVEAQLLVAVRAAAGIAGWLALAWAAARLFDILLLRAATVARRPPYSRLLGDMARGVLFISAVLAIAAQIFEQPALGIITTSGVAVAVIGFALRNIISDLFSGIALSVEAPYRIGDWIETAEGCAGRVVEVSWRATRLMTRDGVTQVVPNGLVAAHRLNNYGAAGSYRIALRLLLPATLAPERARRVLLAAALDAGRDYPSLAPDVILWEMTDGAALWLVRFHVPDYGREAACRDAVAAAVLRALQHAGLEVARPGRTLQVERPTLPAARPRREALLRQVPLFRDFLRAERVELAQHLQERLLPRGTTIVRQGEAADSLFILAEGALDVRMERGGTELALDRMVPGDIFGEMSLLTGQPRSATVAAATEAVVFEIGKQHLDPILQRRPELAEALAAMMVHRQARNAEGDRLPVPAEAADPHREADLLGRLRAFFRLGPH